MDEASGIDQAVGQSPFVRTPAGELLSRVAVIDGTDAGSRIDTTTCGSEFVRTLARSTARPSGRGTQPINSRPYCSNSPDKSSRYTCLM